MSSAANSDANVTDVLVQPHNGLHAQQQSPVTSRVTGMCLLPAVPRPVALAAPHLSFYMSVCEGWGLLEPAGTDTHSVVGGLVCDIGLKCTRSSQPFLATPSTVFYRTRRRQMNFLTATGPKLGPRRPRNVPGSTAADQQNRFYDTGKLYYESLASLPCTVRSRIDRQGQGSSPYSIWSGSARPQFACHSLPF